MEGVSIRKPIHAGNSNNVHINKFTKDELSCSQAPRPHQTSSTLIPQSNLDLQSATSFSQHTPEVNPRSNTTDERPRSPPRTVPLDIYIELCPLGWASSFGK